MNWKALSLVLAGILIGVVAHAVGSAAAESPEQPKQFTECAGFNVMTDVRIKHLVAEGTGYG